MGRVILTGITSKGKNRVRELGRFWRVVEQRHTVPFSSLNGPWILLQPLQNYSRDKVRWVHLTKDADFSVTEEMTVQYVLGMSADESEVILTTKEKWDAGERFDVVGEPMKVVMEFSAETWEEATKWQSAFLNG